MSTRELLSAALGVCGITPEVLNALTVPQLRRAVREVTKLRQDHAELPELANAFADFASRWSTNPAPPGLWGCRGSCCPGLDTDPEASPHPPSCLAAAWLWPGPAGWSRHNDVPRAGGGLARLLLQIERAAHLEVHAAATEAKLVQLSPALAPLIAGLMNVARTLWQPNYGEALNLDRTRRRLLQVLLRRSQEPHEQT